MRKPEVIAEITTGICCFAKELQQFTAGKPNTKKNQEKMKAIARKHWEAYNPGVPVPEPFK
jgi:DNA topoisomerase VI subunit B